LQIAYPKCEPIRILGLRLSGSEIDPHRAKTPVANVIRILTANADELSRFIPGIRESTQPDMSYRRLSGLPNACDSARQHEQVFSLFPMVNNRPLA
jgi:hypothetical protein